MKRQEQFMIVIEEVKASISKVIRLSNSCNSYRKGTARDPSPKHLLLIRMQYKLGILFIQKYALITLYKHIYKANQLFLQSIYY